LTEQDIEEIEELDTCQHHWIIESPNGPTSGGTCKICGTVREFKNSMPLSGWEREPAETRQTAVVKVPIDNAAS